MFLAGNYARKYGYLARIVVRSYQLDSASGVETFSFTPYPVPATTDDVWLEMNGGAGWATHIGYMLSIEGDYLYASLFYGTTSFASAVDTISYHWIINVLYASR